MFDLVKCKSICTLPKDLTATSN